MRALIPTATALAALTVPAAAQDSDTELVPDEGRLVTDLSEVRSADTVDPVLAQRCAEEAEAARIAGEIVVCRSLGTVTDGAWNQADFIRRYAEATQGVKAPDVDGSGIILPTEGSVIAITVTTEFGDPPPPALIIDVEALPEAPEGSDARRIADGLPPLSE